MAQHTRLADKYEATEGPIVGVNNAKYGGYYTNSAGRRMVCVNIALPNGKVGRDYIAIEDLMIEVDA